MRQQGSQSLSASNSVSWGKLFGPSVLHSLISNMEKTTVNLEVIGNTNEATCVKRTVPALQSDKVSEFQRLHSLTILGFHLYFCKIVLIPSIEKARHIFGSFDTYEEAVV